MAQSPITVIDGTETAAVARVEINGALEALATLSSGATAPSTTFSGMFWHDTSTGILKIRSEADDAWINVGYLDQSNNEFKPYVGGTQVDTQSTATWEAGTSTIEGIVSPAKVKAAINVGAEVAALSEGAVGTYVFGFAASGTAGFGSTRSGSTIYPYALRSNGATGNGSYSNYFFGGNSGSLSGTWRQMGGYQTFNSSQITLWLRIA